MSFQPASIRTLQRLRTGNKLDDLDLEEQKQTEGGSQPAGQAEAKKEDGNPELDQIYDVLDKQDRASNYSSASQKVKAASQMDDEAGSELQKEFGATGFSYSGNKEHRRQPTDVKLRNTSSRFHPAQISQLIQEAEERSQNESLVTSPKSQIKSPKAYQFKEREPPNMDPSDIKFDEKFKNFLDEYDRDTVLQEELDDLEPDELMNPLASLYQNDDYLKLKQNFEE